MPSIDLSIIERGVPGQQWSPAQGVLTASALDAVVEQQTDSNSALNALPTPFARFFVGREAFRRALEELRNPQKKAGAAYQRIVSDTLDAFEILYHSSQIEGQNSNTFRIVVKEWDAATDLKRMKEKAPILGKALDTYMMDDLGQDVHKLYFLLLATKDKEFLLATSSPFTGWITPPDLDRVKTATSEEGYAGKRYEALPRIKRVEKTPGWYFRNICLFDQRNPDFKNFLYNLALNSAPSPQWAPLRDYILQNKNDHDLSQQWQPHTEAVLSDQNNKVAVGSLLMMRYNGVSPATFFSETLLRVPFKLSEEHFHTMPFENDRPDRSYDFLIPIKAQALAYLDKGFSVRCKEKSTTVEITLEYEGKQYQKEYATNQLPGTAGASQGSILPLGGNGAEVNIALFPNRLSDREEENNYFKVMLAACDGNPLKSNFDFDNLTLGFHKYNPLAKSYEAIGEIGRSNDNKASYGVYEAAVRSSQDYDSSVPASTKFYEVFKTAFDIIAVNWKFPTPGAPAAEGLLLPAWSTAAQSTLAYTYAIDLGTTNTYIACRKNNDNNKPTQFATSDLQPIVSYLNQVVRNRQLSSISQIEDALPQALRLPLLTEFVPAIIDGQHYRFPLRTALCLPSNTPPEHKHILFDNANIAFAYGKMVPMGNQTIKTDVKWDQQEQDLRLFIRELLLLIRTDLLQKNGKLTDTRIVWFRPLSFRGDTRAVYTKIWQEEAKQILGITPDRISCVTESEAPYYFFNRDNQFKSVEAVSLIDIGGGSTDFMYFANGKPQLANSVRFGCDVLWGDGFGFGNKRENGIYNFLRDKIKYEDATLQEVNRAMISDPATGARDILNFWMGNDEENNGQVKRLLRENFKPLFLYHLTSIVYFAAWMYKVKNKSCPRSVVFCGNGSRYIDEIVATDSAVVTRLVSEIFKWVYQNEQLPSIQVLLPQERKECTCYGGLYHNDSPRKDAECPPQQFNFQGVDDREYANVGELKEALPTMLPRLRGRLEDLASLYKHLLSILVSNQELTGCNTGKMKAIVSEDMEDAIKTNFHNQVVEEMEAEEKYQDSVFFLPLRTKVFELSKALNS